jgi:hypothetical protein
MKDSFSCNIVKQINHNKEDNGKIEIFSFVSHVSYFLCVRDPDMLKSAMRSVFIIKAYHHETSLKKICNYKISHGPGGVLVWTRTRSFPCV